jgi:hypothetical protein
MEKKIVYRVECRLADSGRSATAYFFLKDDAEESMVAFRKKHGYNSIVSMQDCGIEDEPVNFDEML